MAFSPLCIFSWIMICAGRFIFHPSKVYMRKTYVHMFYSKDPGGGGSEEEIGILSRACLAIIDKAFRERLLLG